MNKHTAAIILPYYGKFPNYFPLWLKSAGANPSFTFMIFTDIDMSGCKIPANVHVHAMLLEEIRQRAAKYLDFEPVLNTPYKLCDYKPMFGLIFEDYLAGYDFWGFCDADLIFGNMSKFITDDLLDRYDRLYRNGHIQLLRNVRDVNCFVRNNLPYWNISYYDIYRLPGWRGFDEFELSEHLFANFVGEGRQYFSPDFADPSVFYKEFRSWNGRTVTPAYRWKNGRVFSLAVNGNPELTIEHLYMHFIKRPMKFTPGLEEESSFMAVPNEFVKDHELTQEEIAQLMTPDPQYEQEMYAKYGKMFGPRPTILSRIKTLIKKLVSNDPEKIYKLKLLENRLLRRRLPSKW